MNPRGQLEKIIGTSKSKDLAAKLARIQGAHDNGWEAYSLFSTGVLAAVFAGADKDDAARLSIVRPAAVAVGFLLRHAIGVGNSRTLAKLRSSTALPGSRDGDDRAPQCPRDVGSKLLDLC